MALTERSYTSAVMAMQGLMKAWAPSLIVDGKFGTFTSRVLSGLPGEVQSRVDAVVRTLGSTVEELRAFRLTQKATELTLGPDWIAATNAAALVRREASSLGLDKYADALVEFLSKEPAKRVVDGVTYYNIRSKSGSYLGLFQMGRAAWADAAKKVSLPPYDQGVFDPVMNIRAGLAYAKFNIDGLLKRGKPINGDTLYLAHNQGLGFFDGVRTNVVGQSSEVQALIRRYT